MLQEYFICSAAKRTLLTGEKNTCHSKIFPTNTIRYKRPFLMRCSVGTVGKKFNNLTLGGTNLSRFKAIPTPLGNSPWCHAAALTTYRLTRSISVCYNAMRTTITWDFTSDRYHQLAAERTQPRLGQVRNKVRIRFEVGFKRELLRIE